MADTLSVDVCGLTAEELVALVRLADSRGVTVSQYILLALREQSLAFRLCQPEDER